MSTRRLFFALWPNDRQRDQLRNAISPVAKNVEGQAVYRGDWHVTTAFIGNFDEARIPELLGMAGEIEMQPFRLRFDRCEFWPRPKIAALVASSVPAELQHLVLSLEAMLDKLDVEVESRTYRPHITVVRRARPFEVQRLAQAAVTEWSGFELIESSSDPRGSNYRPVKE